MDFSADHDNEPLSAFSLSGLADIILLLLIFFLLTSSFVNQFGIQVTLPKADAASVTDAQQVTVSITDDGRYFVGDDPVIAANLMREIRDQKGEKTALVLRADEGATVKQFATVANIAKALDLRVLMATERESRR